MNIDEREVEFECDSGSRSSVMSIQQYRELGLNFPIKKTNVIFRSYTGNSFKPAGVLTVQVSYNGKSSFEELYFDFDKNVISCRTCNS